jgi:hypothetical protein
MVESALLDAALAYAARGWPVHPLHDVVRGRCSCGRPGCAHAGKHPRLTAWQRVATTDPGTIRDLWKRSPDANVAIVTGARSGIVVPDVDPRHGGDAMLAELEARYDPLPETPTSLTGGGGRHPLLAHPGGVVPNRVGLWPGIDLRGDGGFIVAPPSRTTGVYQWQIGYAPDDLPLAPLPPWLLDAVRRSERGGDRLRADGTPLVVRDGERNHRCFQIACALRRYGVNAAALRDALIAINREHCAPPLAGDELARIAASAAGYSAALRPQPEAARWRATDEFRRRRGGWS